MKNKKFLILGILIVILFWFFVDRNIISLGGNTTDNRTRLIEIPPELKNSKEAGLQYIKENYASFFSQGMDLCVNFFKGQWNSEQDILGCSSMEGFTDIICGFNEVKDIEYACDEIGGFFTCSPTEIRCIV